MPTAETTADILFLGMHVYILHFASASTDGGCYPLAGDGPYFL